MVRHILYPDSVSERASEIAETLLSDPVFIEDYPNVTMPIIVSEFGKVLFDLWMAGEDLVLDCETANRTLGKCVATSLVEDLLEEELLDCVESDGVEHLFITPKGRAYKEFMQKVRGMDIINPEYESVLNKFI